MDAMNHEASVAEVVTTMLPNIAFRRNIIRGKSNCLGGVVCQTCFGSTSRPTRFVFLGVVFFGVVLCEIILSFFINIDCQLHHKIIGSLNLLIGFFVANSRGYVDSG